MAAPYGQPQYGPPPPAYSHPHPQYAPPPPQHYPMPAMPPMQQQQQSTTVVMNGQGDTMVVQQRKQRFADNIPVNLLIACIFPFWLIIWIIMCMVEK